MNTKQVNASFRTYVGQMQERAGILLGSQQQQLRGLQKQVLGRAERKLGDQQAWVKQGSLRVW